MNYTTNVADWALACDPLGTWERIRSQLYDTVPIAGQAVELFCGEVVGQGEKTLSETNMLLPASLPAGQAFVVEGITVKCRFDTPRPRAEAKFYRHAVVTLIIGSKWYFQGKPVQYCDGEPVTRIRFEPDDKAGTVRTTVTQRGIESPINLTPETLFIEAHQYVEAIPFPCVKGATVFASLDGFLCRRVY